MPVVHLQELSFREMVILLNLTKSCQVSAYFRVSSMTYSLFSHEHQTLVGAELKSSEISWVKWILIYLIQCPKDKMEWGPPTFLAKTIAFDFLGSYLCLFLTPSTNCIILRTLNHIWPFSFFNFPFFSPFSFEQSINEA